jgi:hypothetical protein
LSDLEIGITCGPVSAVLQSGIVLLQMLVPRRLPLVSKALSGIYHWVMLPIKYLDIPMSRHRDAHLLAAGFYAMGRKPERPEEPGRART